VNFASKINKRAFLEKYYKNMTASTGISTFSGKRFLGKFRFHHGGFMPKMFWGF
jgi:hypothetical protein